MSERSPRCHWQKKRVENVTCLQGLIRKTCAADLVHLGVPERLLDGLESPTEQIGVEFLKAGAGDGGVEVDALVQRVDFDAGLGRARQGSLGALAGGPQPAHRTLVVRDVLLVFTLELLHEVVHHTVVEILTCVRTKAIRELHPLSPIKSND